METKDLYSFFIEKEKIANAGTQPKRDLKKRPKRDQKETKERPKRDQKEVKRDPGHCRKFSQRTQLSVMLTLVIISHFLMITK